MFSPEGDAHNAVLLSLAAFLLAIPAFIVSLWAVIISRTVARRTTEPILMLRILRLVSGARIELQNMGAVTTTGIRLDLIEKQRRSSALLHVNDTLATGESCPIIARDFPEELNAEFRDQNWEDANTAILRFSRIMNNDPNPVETPPDQMAFHLLTRKGGQRIILSCAIPDKARQQRIYKVRHSKFQMCTTFLVGFRANYLRFRFKKNAVLRPAPEMPEFLKIDSEEP